MQQRLPVSSVSWNYAKGFTKLQASTLEALKFAAAKLERKNTQHAQLVHLLKEAGWKVAGPRIFLFGVRGTVFKQIDHILRQLGVTSKAAHACLLKMHSHSALWVDRLVKLRRHHATNSSI